jgi:acyl dehydratase
MNSLFTLGLMIGIMVNHLTVGTTIANLGMTEVKFPHPLLEGDTVHCTTEVINKRRHRGRAPASWSSTTAPITRTTSWWPSAAARCSCACGRADLIHGA